MPLTRSSFLLVGVRRIVATTPVASGKPRRVARGARLVRPALVPPRRVRARQGGAPGASAYDESVVLNVVDRLSGSAQKPSTGIARTSKFLLSPSQSAFPSPRRSAVVRRLSAVQHRIALKSSVLNADLSPILVHDLWC